MNSMILQKRSISLKILGAVSLMLASTVHAIIDSNSNGMSDLWEENFNQLELFPPSFDPQADPDNDGWTNAQEAAAGTDPFDPNPPSGFIRPDIAHSPAVWHDPDGDGIYEIDTPEAHVVTWPTLAGKKYTLLLSVDLTAGSWIPIGQPRIGEGTLIGTGIPLTENDTSMFWRVKIEDIDTDDDGITDHEESQLGTDPYLADRDRDGLPDRWELAYGLDANDDGNTNYLFGAYGDLDGDGANNLEEFLDETDPTDPTDIPVQIHSIARISQHQTNDNPGSEQSGRWLVSRALWDQAIPINTQLLSTTHYDASAIGPDLASKISFAATQPATALKYPLPARVIILENGSYTRYPGSSETDPFITTHSSLTQSRLWMKIPTKRVSTVAQKIPYLFVTLRTVYDCQPDGSGNASIFQPAGTLPPTRTVYSHETVKFEFDPNSIDSKPLDVNSQLSGEPVGKSVQSEYRVIRPEVSWKAIGDHDNLGDHVDPWTNKPNGKRMFPDYMNPNDTEIRPQVEVIVKTSPDLVGKAVFVKAFDVDDSTSEDFDREKNDYDPNTQEDAIIDTNGKSGEDNLIDYIGTPKNGQFWTGAAWGNNTTQGIVDGNGETKFIFRVGMQPGNNYRVVASIIDESMYAGVQTTDAASLYYLGPELHQNGEAPASPLLTVWRRLWVENDSMRKIPKDQFFKKRNDLSSNFSDPVIDDKRMNVGGTDTVFSIPKISDASSFISLENGHIWIQSQNQSHPVTGTGEVLEEHLVSISGNHTTVPIGTKFRLYDDDDFGLNRDPLPQTELIDDIVKNVYRPAFIEVINAADFESNDYNPEKEVDFKQNHPATAAYLDPLHLVWEDAKNLTDKRECWVGNLIAGYQNEHSDDADPRSEEGSDGLTPDFSRRYSIVYVETVRESLDGSFRDIPQNDTINNEKLILDLKLTAAHELGHMPGGGFGYMHHNELQLMGEGGADMNEDGQVFSPKSIMRFRKTRSWQQPWN